MDKGWDITVDGRGARDAMSKFNVAMESRGLNFGASRRLQRAAIELLVGSANVNKTVRIVCSGNGSGYVALSVSVTLDAPEYESVEPIAHVQV